MLEMLWSPGSVKLPLSSKDGVATTAACAKEPRKIRTPARRRE